MSRAAAPHAGYCIVMVENEYLIAAELKRWLQQAGAEVIGAVPNVGQTLDLIEERRLDAAVLDVILGDGDNACAIAGKLGVLGVLGVPYLFATNDMRLADGLAYRH